MHYKICCSCMSLIFILFIMNIMNIQWWTLLNFQHGECVLLTTGHFIIELTLHSQINAVFTQVGKDFMKQFMWCLCSSHHFWGPILLSESKTTCSAWTLLLLLALGISALLDTVRQWTETVKTGQRKGMTCSKQSGPELSPGCCDKDRALHVWYVLYLVRHYRSRSCLV